MASALHQMTMSFSPEDDRISLRVSTTDKTEYQLWLTRRFTGVLWPALMEALEKEPKLKRDLMPAARKAVVAMEHHEAMQGADFSHGHEEGNRDLTSGTGPLLVVGGSVKPGAQVTRLLLQTQNGAEINLSLSKDLLHVLCRLLIETTMKAGWDLSLTVGDAAAVVPGDSTRVH